MPILHQARSEDLYGHKNHKCVMNFPKVKDIIGDLIFGEFHLQWQIFHHEKIFDMFKLLSQKSSLCFQYPNFENAVIKYCFLRCNLIFR